MIEKLENNELILLMYLADELPEEDRAEVDQMLTADTSLRSELHRLEAARRSVDVALGRLDELSPIRPDRVAARLGRVMRQRLVEPVRVKPTPVVEPANRAWKRLYPSAVAAALVLVGLLWVEQKLSGPDLQRLGPTHVTRPEVASTEPAPQSRPDGQEDPDSALLMASLQSPLEPDSGESRWVSEDETPVTVAQLGETIPQDEISSYLLSEGTGTRQ